ncbi:MAG: hypothetical protein ACRD8O_12285 [Bryobacteraceae bacterium]
MRRRAWIWIFFLAPLTAGPQSDYASARDKFDRLRSERLRPGSRVTLSQRELNAWLNAELGEVGPPGVRDPKLELGEQQATGSAMVDFLKIRQARGKPPGWLMSRLLEGERPVRVKTRIRSKAGLATVDVESVEISGVSIEGRVLQYVIDYYLSPNYPDAKVGKPFELGYGIDRLELRPGSAVIVIRQ